MDSGKPTPAASTQDVSDKRYLTGYTPSSSLRRKVMLFGVLCILVVILFIITIANLVLLVQNQSQIARNSATLQSADDIHPFIQKDIEAALKSFKTDIVKEVLDHPVTTDHINKTVDDALVSWGGGILTHLQEELGITQNMFQRRVETILANMSTITVNRLKEELEIDPVHLERAVHKALNNLSDRSLALIRGVCEIAYGGKCYWVVKTGSIPYKHAEALCENRGAMAANIYDEGHYQAMVKYIRLKMSITMNSVWIGMTRDPTSDQNFLVNGTESAFKIPWAQNYPISNSQATHLGISINFAKNESYTGFFNDKTINRRMGILCEL